MKANATIRAKSKFRKFVWLTGILIMAGLASSAHGLVWIWDSTNLQWTTYLVDGKPIDTTINRNANDPQTAIDAIGNTYVVFRQVDGAGNSRIYLSRYDASGVVTIWDNDSFTWTANLLQGDPIDAATGGAAQDPQLAIDSNDWVYVVFSQIDGTGDDRIYISRYNGTDVKIYAGAGTWSSVFGLGSPIDANTGNPARAPQLAINSGNQVYVAFYQNDGAENHIYLSRYDGFDVRIWQNNFLWTTTFNSGNPIDTGIAGREADSPKIAIDALGRIYVAYRQDDGTSFNVFLSRYTISNALEIWNSGAGLWTATQSNGGPVGLPGATGDVLGPELTVDANDQVYIAYAQQRTVVNRVFLSRYDGSEIQIWGDPWTDNLADGVPIDAGNFEATVPQVIVDSSNNTYVAYGQIVAGIFRIHLSRWNGTDIEIWDTAGWTTTLADGDPIDAATGQAAFSPQMAVDTMDRVYVTYHQGDGADTRIYLSRYDDDANPNVVEIWNQTDQTWTTTFSDAAPIDAATGGAALSPQLAANTIDEVFITFFQNDGIADHIFLSAYEPLGNPPSAPGISPGPPGGGGGGSGISCFINTSDFGRLFAP